MSTRDFLEKLAINTSLVRRVLVDFIRDEVTRVGIARAVIGLSGGIDSALVAFLTAEALGPDNVLGVRMPYKSSAQESADHAMLVIEALGMRHETVEITPMVDPLFDRFPEMTPIRKGNIMARQRMVVLFDQSVAFGGLVVGTSNKTETLLGYTTQFGDNAAAILPIGDLYKHQVRQLARTVGVPEPIIAKPPSADLWPGQTDEGELGYTYDNVDQLLYLLVDKRYALEAAAQTGFPVDFVNHVYQQIRKTHYKRHLPVIAKLSQRTIGYDFLYMRDWGT
jgi:NAD+ synthase